MAVVKADGYGHGIVESARAALAGGAAWLGVAFVREALALRQAGVRSRVLTLLPQPDDAYEDAIAADVDISASASRTVAEVAAAARRIGRVARVHLKVDTGLTRGGAPSAEWPSLLADALHAQAEGSLRVVGVWSHLARADEPGHPSVAAAVFAFREALDTAWRAGARPEVRHLANSPATLTAPETHFDLVRVGGACYGLNLLPGTPADYGLRPAMTLRTGLALVKRVPGGSGVSYGHRYTTGGETTVGLVPVGYADGVPRHATNTAEVLVGGRRRRIAGTVSMDQFVVDLGGDGATAGDEVVLFGPGDRGEPTIAEWADALGTIPYEIAARIGPRIRRTYVEGA